MRIIFMGTPDFSVPTLRTLAESRHEVVGVYTQPDKEQGRGKKVVCSPVKEYALSQNIPVFQPKGLKKEEVLSEMRALNADVIVVAAYGKILREPVLKMCKYGCINVHASLLPKYRGCAPIQYCILDGETETGVTIMQMDEGLDTGDMLATKKIPIAKDETGDSLFEKMSNLGGEPLLEVLDQAEQGTLNPIKQGETTTVYAGMIEKEMGQLDFNEDAIVLERKIRAFNSWPSAYTFRDGKVLKIWRADVVAGKENAAPGSIVHVTKHDFCIQCKTGALKLVEVQPEGKKRMDVDAYLRGYQVTEGELLG